MNARVTRGVRYSAPSAENRADLRVELLEVRLQPAGHTLATASAPVLGPLAAASVSGYIASPEQVDLYRVHLGTGDRLTTAVVAQTVGSGLAPVVRVFDAAGHQVAANDQEGGDPGLTFQAKDCGDYFVGVSSAGNTAYDPNASTGAAGGSSRGTYALALSVRPDQLLLADLAGSSFRLTESVAAWGDVIHPTFTIENRGGADAGPFDVQLYLSPNGLIDPNASVPLLTVSVGGLAAGAEWSPADLALTLPSLATAQAAGFSTSGPVAIGLRIIPSDPALGAGTADKGGVHRGADWEALTVVTPVVGPVADLSQVDSGLNTRANGTYGGAPALYPFTVSPALGIGRLDVQLRTLTGGAAPQLALYGGAAGQTLLEQSGAGTDGTLATLATYLTPGTYVLSVTGSGPGDYRLTTTFAAANAPARTVPTGASPIAAAVGDFDNDGRLDLAVANGGDSTGAGTVQILLGNGDGTFRTGPSLADGAGPQAVAVADLNADGKADVAVANADGTVGVFLGTGDGTFRTQATSAAGVGASSLAAGDLNGDGAPDVVVANSGAGTVGVLLGNGDGTFQTVRTTSVGAGPSSVTIADLNGDGIPDLAVAGGDVSVLLGKGDGTFRPGPTLAAGSGSRSVAAADLNGDGRPDLVVANSGESGVSVLVNNTVPGAAAPTFAARQTFATGTAPVALAVADLNGDGKLDVVVTNSGDSNASVLLNATAPGASALSFAARQTFAVGSNPVDVVVADLDGDAAPDLVAVDLGFAARPGNGVNVLRANGDGSFRGPSVLAGGNGPVSVAAADFNGDGKLDTAVADVEQNRVTVELGKGDGTFAPQAPVPVGARPLAVSAADINNDGKPDLVVANFDGGTVGVLRGNGDGTFRPQETYQVGIRPAALAVADVNGDGKLDILVANNGDDTVGVLLGNGDGTFRPGPTYRVGWGFPTGQPGTFAGVGPVSLAVADLNGDGKLDVVVTDALDNSVDVLIGNSDGTFRIGQQQAVQFQPGAARVADVTGDGNLDVVLANPGASTVGLLRGNGDGAFQVEQVFAVGRRPTAVSVADVNGDGKPDLVVTNADDNTVSVLIGEGGGAFQIQRTFATGQAPAALAVLDANGDGKPDVVAGNYGDDTLTSLLGNGDGTFAAATPANSVAAANATQLVDLNRDGITDSLTLDGSGRILYRQGLGANQYAPPRALNPATRPARAFTPLLMPTGWAVAAADAAPASSAAGQPIYTVSLYTLADSGDRVAFSTPLLPTGIAAADLTGDGRDDLVVAGALDGAIQIAFQNPDGTFQPRITLPTGAAPSAIAFADVNGDHQLDVLVTNQASGDVSVFFNDAQHTFATGARLRAGTSTSGIDTTSTITTVVGNGFLPYSGDAGPGSAALVSTPSGVAVDAAGNLFIADTGNNVVRVVAAGTGIITTVAGTGLAGYYGDGGAAAAAQLNNPVDVAVDAAGNLFIADSGNNVIRRVNTKTGVISTVAGTGVAGFAGNGTPATAARLNNPTGIALDAAGNLFIADSRNHLIRRVNAATGIITAIVGTGQAGYTGDNGASTAARLNNPSDVAVDAAGNLYIADTFNNVVRKVAADTGVITTVAGTGVAGFSGNGTPAITAKLSNPTGVAVDAGGNLFIADSLNHLIRRVNAATGIITAVVGTGQVGYTGDGGAPTAAQLDLPEAVAFDAAGNMFIADTFNNAVRKVDTRTQIITTVAGNGLTKASGNGGPATDAQIYPASVVAVDAAGNLFIPDPGNNMIRKVAAGTGVITIAAGSAAALFGYSGDGGPATAAQLDFPEGVAVDAAGNLFIADTLNNVIREVAVGTGIITTVAGSRDAGYSGDGGTATAAQLNRPKSVAVDALGNLFIADTLNNVIRQVNAQTGIISTVAGTGVAGFSGDGAAATAAQLNNPKSVAADALGNLFIADTLNNVVRQVNAQTGIISTVAGTGVAGFSGDGGAATAAQLNNPSGVSVDAVGNLFIADTLNNVVRQVNAQTGIIATVVGNFSQGGGYFGDGGPATAARLRGPAGVTVTATGDLFIADTGNNVVRKVAIARSAVSSPDQTVTLAVGDFTGDGRTDLLTVNRGTHSFTVLPGNGAGGFGAPRPALTTPTSDGLGVNAEPGAVVIGDFNTASGLDATRAGKDDVAVLMKDTGEVWIFTNNGDGTFRHTSSIPVGSGATGLALSRTPTGLFNLQVGNKFGDVLTLLGNGDGTFRLLRLVGKNTAIAVQTGAGGTIEALVGDQQSDRVTVQAPQSGGSQFAPLPVVLGGTASAALAPTDPTTTQLAPGAVVWAPLDRGSTLADAIVIASGSNSVLVYRRISDAGGQPVFARPVSYAVGTNPVGVTVADINGDGVADLLVANKGSNDVSVLFGGYDASGNWVGTPGPRLKSAGAGPVAVNLVKNAASPGGQDLAVTNQDGTINVLPGRGQGFFDDRTPRVLSLGAPITKAPTFGPGNGIGFAVTTDQALVRFDLTAPTAPTTTVTDGGVLAAVALPDGRVVEVMTGGRVELITPGQDGGESLFPLGGVPQDPSALAVIALGSFGIEALVTNEGSGTVFAFLTEPSAVEVLPFETRGGLAQVGSPFALVSTLLTALPTDSPADSPDPAPAAISNGGPLPPNPLLFGVSTDPGSAALARSASLGDDEFLPTAGAEFASAVLLNPIVNGEDAVDPKVPAELQEIITGTTEGLQRLVDAARAGKKAPARPAQAEVAELWERLLQFVRELPDVPLSDEPKQEAPRQEETGPADAPTPEKDAADASGAQLPTDGLPTDATADGRGGSVAARNRTEFPEWSIPVDLPPAPREHQQTEPENSPPPEDASPLWLLAVLPAFVRGGVDRRRAAKLQLMRLPEDRG